MLLRLVKYDSKSYVLDTDYSTYAIVYGCGTFGDIPSGSMVWIYGRKRKLDAEIIEKAEELLTGQGISTGPIQTADQVDCDHYGN